MSNPPYTYKVANNRISGNYVIGNCESGGPPVYKIHCFNPVNQCVVFCGLDFRGQHILQISSL